MRNYSLSRAHVEGSYRISVKREGASVDGGPAGFVSNHLHDHVGVGDELEIGAPCGEFTLGEPKESPVALIAGGVGITPLLAMAQHLAEAQPDRPLYLIRGARGQAHHAFNKELRALAESHPNMHLHIRFDDATPEDIKSGLCESGGLIDSALLSAFLPLDEMDAYVCGPQGMMKAVLGALRSLGVAPERLHHEFFGPAGSL